MVQQSLLAGITIKGLIKRLLSIIEVITHDEKITKKAST